MIDIRSESRNNFLDRVKNRVKRHYQVGIYAEIFLNFSSHYSSEIDLATNIL